jgi:hypothetical protein
VALTWSDDRWQAMLKGRRAVRVVPMPGMPEGEDAVVGVRILSDDELDDALKQATTFVLHRAKSMGVSAELVMAVDSDVRMRELERCIVAKAFVQPEPDAATGKHAPFFEAGATALRAMDSVLVRQFFEAYSEHQEFVNPSRFTEADLEALVNDLGKGLGAEAGLLTLSAPSLRTCVLILAARLQS